MKPFRNIFRPKKYTRNEHGFCCFYCLVITKHQCTGREREESNSHFKK